MASNPGVLCIGKDIKRSTTLQPAYVSMVRVWYTGEGSVDAAASTDPFDQLEAEAATLEELAQSMAEAAKLSLLSVAAKLKGIVDSSRAARRKQIHDMRRRLVESPWTQLTTTPARREMDFLGGDAIGAEVMVVQRIKLERNAKEDELLTS